MLQLRTLGGFSASDGSGATVTLPRHRWALLALVAAAGERGVSRDKVLACLWPEVPDHKARARLQQMLHAIRQSVDPGLFQAGDPLRLTSAVVWTDVGAFHAALDRGDLEAAVTVYRGAFLDGFHLGDAPEFDEWLEAERRELAQERASALEQLAVRASTASDHLGAVRWWRALAASDPLNSRLALKLSEALLASGDRAGALRHAIAHAALVRAEVGVAVDPAVAELIKELNEDATTPPADRPLRRAVTPTASPELVNTSVLATASPPEGPEIIRRRDRRLLAAAAVIVVAIIGGLWARGRRIALPNAIVVAPFDIFDPSLDLWRTGLVDVLSRNFDGTGPLRAVPPSVAIGRWAGRADSASARAFARSVGAQLVVYGSLLRAGPDSAQVRASVLDAEKGMLVAEVAYREAIDRLDRVADSVSVRLLRRLNESRQLGLPRMASLGSGNPAAVKAFLRGGQFARRRQIDSAMVYYTRAIEEDNAFALAYASRGYSRWSVVGWHDSLAAEDVFRAAALIKGLSRRDSLLIQADSLAVALERSLLPRSHAARLFQLLEPAAREYPDDPQIAYALGDAWYHMGSWFRIDVARERALGALRRAVAVDPTFPGDAYHHVMGLLADVNDTAQLVKTIDAYLRHAPPDPELSLARLIVRGERISKAVADSFVLLRNAPMPGGLLKVLADTGEVALGLLRRRLESRHELMMSWTDSFYANTHLASALLRRGHWREAIGLPLTIGRQIVEPAVLGVAPDDTARMLAVRAGGGPPRRLAMMLPWLVRRGDTLAIDSLLRDASAHPAPADRPRVAEQLRYFHAAAPAFTAIVRGDTAAAVRILEAIPDSQCIFPACPYLYLERVRLARAQRQFAKAYAMSQFLPEYDIYSVGIAFVLERAYAAEALGKYDEAIDAYRHVIDSWKHADPEFGPLTQAALAGLERVRVRAKRAS